MLESEYVLATAATQLEWIRSVIEDLRAGKLSWSAEKLRPLAEDASAKSGIGELPV